MKNPKLNEITVATLTRLVSHNLIDARQEDTSYENQLDEFPELSEDFKGKANGKTSIAESLIYSVSQCLMEKEESIIQALKLLIAIATNGKCGIMGNSLVRIIRTLIYVYLQSKPPIDRLIRNGLYQITNLSFQAVEQDFTLLRPKKNLLSSMDQYLTLQKDISPTIINKQNQVKTKEGIDFFLKDQNIPPSFLNLEGNELISSNKQRKTSINDKAPHVKLCNQILTQMVDDVQLFYGKQEKYGEEEVIPVRSVPWIFIPDDQHYRQLYQVELRNEINAKSGRFGWCIMCRMGADLYCKDYRVPVCSYLCKRQHGEFVDMAQRLYENTIRWQKESMENALVIFESLCKLLGSKSNQTLRNQQILLEMILQVLDCPDETLLNNQTFMRIIKEVLCSQLLKYCLEPEKNLFYLSFKIFLKLFYYLKKQLKHEIGIFIDQIFLKILESGNSSFPHRQIALEVLMKMFERRKTALEFYLNFDCSMDHVCLLEKIINLLHSIIDGNYTKIEYQAVINPQQEAQLRVIAVHTICNIVNGLQKTFQELNPIREDLPVLTKKQQQEEDDEGDQNEILNEIEKQRQLKQEFQKGIELFNKNPEKGIKFLLKAGIINDNPLEISIFMRQNQSVTKDAIGQFFGGEHQLNQKVLSEYTDKLSFKNMSVENALRYYLDQFTLPGESQQVDRVIQKFSDKYFRDNHQGLFKSSDSVYTFSYLLIMLQTDLHNPRVEEKMKLQDFAKLAKGIEGDDLPHEYLLTTYTNIQKTPLAIHEKEKAQKFLQDSSTQSLRKKQDLFAKETQQLIKKGNELIKNKSQSAYLKVDSAQYIKLLLEVVGLKLFQTLIQSFQWELPDGHQLIQLIVQSLIQMICLYAYFRIPVDTFIEKIVKLTGLWTYNDKLSEKQLLLLHQILSSCQQSGNGLKIGGWKPILEMVSRLDELRNILIEQSFQLIIDYDLIEKIFIKTKILDDEAIQDFIQALCFISKQELAGTNKRTFSLQKLVEVSDYNMDRIKIIWAKMWNIVRDHLSEVGTKSSLKISLFAVDQLRQLSVKFLQKEELYSFQFQREFLKPFETIFLNVENEEIKEYILSCMHLMVLNYKNNIKSGWRVIFDLINYGLQEESEKISRSAFQILDRIMNHNLDMIQDLFVDLIQSLGKLGKKQQEDLALASIDFIRQCLNYLSAQAQVLPKSQWNEEEDEKPIETEQKHQFTVSQLENYWVPLLGQLSTMAGDTRARVQEQAMDTLFTLLNQFGYAFSTEFWKIVFQVVLRPLFDEIQFTFQSRTNHKPGQNLDTESQKESHWFKNSCQKGFNHITNLVNQYFHKLRELLPDFLKLFENCIQNQNELLAKFSLSAVKNTVMKLGKKFSDDEWNEIIQFCERMFKVTTPSKLLQASIQDLTENLLRKNKTKLKINTEEAYSQCVSQLLLIQVTKDLIENFAPKLTLKSLTRLDVSISNSQAFAKEFNSSVELRYLLWRNGFMAEMKQLPGLLRQEREAQSCTLILKYQIYKKLEDPFAKEEKFKEYKSQLLESFQQFILKHKEFYNDSKELKRSKTTIRQNEEEEEKLLKSEVQKLKIQEIEREATNLRTLIDQTILPKILQLDDSELMSSAAEFFDILLAASQYACERSFIQSTCHECRTCERCQLQQKDSLDSQIRLILKRLFDIVYNR